ncbi:MAG TPA: PEP-CTERM sorting domain-containing protein [Acidobacteria bacterium]|nr:PEP-CTERM sorting domain-containing protein [Acidobacteriota bacterium]
MSNLRQPWNIVFVGVALLLGGLAAAEAQQLTQDFELVTFPPTGWIVRNQSTTIGTNTTCWNRFTTTPWAAHGGSGHSGANFNCTSGANNISGWLVSPQMTNLQNGQQVTFWTRKATPDSFPDRLELRLCLDTTADSCGLATSTGTGDAAVGDFTTLLLSVNPTLITGVYPTTYTQFTATLSGLPGAPSAGRIAFRYFVTNGGPSGANSDILSIDDINVTPVELMSFSVE